MALLIKGALHPGKPPGMILTDNMEDRTSLRWYQSSHIMHIYPKLSARSIEAQSQDRTPQKRHHQTSWS